MIAITLIITVLIIILTNEHVFEPEKIPSLVMVERANRSLELVANAVSKWRREYSHPLIIISASHQAQAYGSEILNRDNWHDFMNDDEINQFLERIEDDEGSNRNNSIVSRLSFANNRPRRKTFEM